MIIEIIIKNLFINIKVVLIAILLASGECQELSTDIKSLLVKYANTSGEKRREGINKLTVVFNENLFEFEAFLHDSDYKIRYFVLEIAANSKNVNLWLPIAWKMVSREQADPVSLKAIEVISFMDGGSSLAISKIIESYSWLGLDGGYLIHESLLRLIAKNPINARKVLLATHSHKSERVREQALNFLRYLKLKKNDIDIFLPYLEDKNLSKKIYAVKALACFPDNLKTFLLLKKLIKSPHPQIRKEALISLGHIGKKASEFVSNIVLMLTTDNKEKVRAEAAETLAKINPKRNLVIPFLIEACNDRSFIVKNRAIFALGELGDVTVIPLIEKFISDPMNSLEASIALKKIKEKFKNK